MLVQRLSTVFSPCLHFNSTLAYRLFMASLIFAHCFSHWSFYFLSRISLFISFHLQKRGGVEEEEIWKHSPPLTLSNVRRIQSHDLFTSIAINNINSFNTQENSEFLSEAEAELLHLWQKEAGKPQQTLIFTNLHVSNTSYSNFYKLGDYFPYQLNQVRLNCKLW